MPKKIGKYFHLSYLTSLYMRNKTASSLVVKLNRSTSMCTFPNVWVIHLLGLHLHFKRFFLLELLHLQFNSCIDFPLVSNMEYVVPLALWVEKTSMGQVFPYALFPLIPNWSSWIYFVLKFCQSTIETSILNLESLNSSCLYYARSFGRQLSGPGYWLGNQIVHQFKLEQLTDDVMVFKGTLKPY